MLAMLMFAVCESVADEPVLPLTKPINLDSKKVTLGKKLFYDAKLSVDGSVSCASCHILSQGGVSQSRYATGALGAKGILNTPTVFNAALNFRQFWNGRAHTLEEQVEGPITSVIEMANTWEKVLVYIRGSKEYVSMFSNIYADGVSRDNMKNAIAEFVKSLVLTGSRFDRFLQGEKDAITPDEKRGYTLFKHYGCVSCHQGANIGGNMFQKLGVFKPYFDDHEEETLADLGRFEYTRNPKDKHVFKVPSLRLAAVTTPYFHDGSVDTLEKAIRIMAEYQLGRKIPDADVKSIQSFLESLVVDPPDSMVLP